MKVKSSRKVNITKTIKKSYRGETKLKEAEVSYRKMLEEIEPFIKKRETTQYSTAGKWKVLSCET